MKRLSLAKLFALVLFAAGCGKEAAEPAKQYEIRGTVTAVNAQDQKVSIDHEDIPGLMQAMEMEFKVASPAIVEGLKAGDKVAGHLESRDGEYVVTDLKKS